MSVEDYDVWVIQFGKVYLVGMPYQDTKVCRFSENIYDAVQFQNYFQAYGFADRFGGKAMRFNPVTGKVCV